MPAEMELEANLDFPGAFPKISIQFVGEEAAQSSRKLKLEL
jgi:hypothetical protein